MIYLDGPQNAYYVYIILCEDGSYYIGLTNDLVKRFKEHQTGVYATCYTFRKRPLQLQYYEMIPFLQDAIQREKQLKGWTKAKKKALVDRNLHKLQLLAECQNFTHHKYKDSH
ncbi:GIY-YIG nuclease family protein [Niastella caeni]|uniref:GIY-YIG nuclease family protein n=1 Tax=Niastella caeni TaxID=2569763 RepID=A0A4S8HT05_9BACT|nr:GIY-YIG nuclease family protein [Niastella caeni]THU38425.1 GIY-YIG nuclease family protein [Niastella caeni]